jgi:cytoskeletal protein CcmA (bactofilin family)
MFRRRNRSEDKTPPASGAQSRERFEAGAASKPNSRQGTAMPESKTPNPPVRPEIAPRRMDIPGMKPREAGRGLPSSSEGKKLIVGRDICLAGEITACDRLIVEGRVEASLTESASIEIAATGYFKGSAEVDIAEIRGCFEGKLTVRKRLVIYATGRVSGEIRYSEIEIESGGVVSGDVRTLADEGAKEAGLGVQTASGEAASVPPTLG